MAATLHSLWRKLAFFTLGTLLILFFAAWRMGGILIAPQPTEIGDLPAGFTGRSVQFLSLSGSQLKGWHLPGDERGGAILLMHGIRSSRLGMLARARFLSQAGYAILLFDFQAHGESAGKQMTFGFMEGKDAHAAVEFLRKTSPGEKIGVIGVSMGGAAAILASPPLDVHAVVLESVYPTINQAIANRLAIRLGEWGGRLTPLFILQLKPRLGIEASDLHPINDISKIKAPKLFITGGADRHTTRDDSVRLYNTATAPKELWMIPDAAHTDLHLFSKEEYERRVLDFFKAHLRG